MHDNHEVIETRLKRVLEERIRPAVYTPLAPLTLTAWHVDGGQGEPVDPIVALGLNGSHPTYQPFHVGQQWGPAWGTSWIHVQGEIPPAPKGSTLELVIDLGFSQSWPGFQAEGLVYRPDGTTIKALNPLNTWVPVKEDAVGIDLYVEAAANPFVFTDNPFLPTQLGEKSTAGNTPRYTMTRADINVFNQDVWELVQDFEVLSQLAGQLDLGNPRRWEITYAIEKALDAVALQDIPGTAAAAREELKNVLAQPAHASAHTLMAIGHAHIDSAWLWPVRETVRKIARTTSNVVNLLELDPDFKFAMSSAQQYQWLKDHRPNAFEKVKKAVESGRFIPVGGMWVESDTNMVGSEAMARQFIYGQRFFQENFGMKCQEVWLPDSFGYSAALPQIVKQAGAKWFLTQKISWNTVNKFPHHTFNWEGIDGTRVFTHFPPVDTYNAQLSGEEIAHAVKNFRDKGAASTSLVPFGWGDGGGGPTREMLARARRSKDLEGSARVEIASPAEFFAAAEAQYPNAPVWKGELYLEMHRGTYTSQAATKEGNRRSEHLLREAELWSSTAAVAGVLEYPYAEIDRLWKLVLLNQFHDILPGSSIAWVHREAAETYAQIAFDLEAIITLAQDALALADAEATPGPLEFNGSPFWRNGVPPLSAAVPVRSDSQVRIDKHDGGATVVDNGVMTVRFAVDGTIDSIYDQQQQREVLPAGQSANLLQLHADFPNAWDAWDIDQFYKNTVNDIRELDSFDCEVVDGAALLHIKRSFRNSQITQTVRIAPDSREIRVSNTVDWHEKETLLKVAFPVDVHSDSALFETQFGHIRRPTHENTSWDNARFEICAHRWVYVEEPGYGAGLINDSKYGHDVSRHLGTHGSSFTTLRLSLLRGPQFPDPETDQGQHQFKYALVVGVPVEGAIEAAYDLNLPPRTSVGAPTAALFSTVPGTAVIESVKLAFDRSGDVIVRLYEPDGGRSKVSLESSFTTASIQENNLLEEPYDSGSVLEVDQGSAVIALRPFQILTLRFSRAQL